MGGLGSKGCCRLVAANKYRSERALLLQRECNQAYNARHAPGLPGSRMRGWAGRRSLRGRAGRGARPARCGLARAGPAAQAHKQAEQELVGICEAGHPECRRGCRPSNGQAGPGAGGRRQAAEPRCRRARQAAPGLGGHLEGAVDDAAHYADEGVEGEGAHACCCCKLGGGERERGRRRGRMAWRAPLACIFAQGPCLRPASRSGHRQGARQAAACAPEMASRVRGKQRGSMKAAERPTITAARPVHQVCSRGVWGRQALWGQA